MKYFTKDWYANMQKNDKLSIRNTEKTIIDYQKYEEQALNKNRAKFINKFVFHDTKIISSQKQGSDLIIKLDNTNSFTNINLIRFKNYHILMQEADLEGLWWLYEEIYLHRNGYEICILLSDDKSELYELSILASDVKYN